LIDTHNDLVQENAPRIRTITKNMVEASHIVREKAVEMDSVVSDATRRAKAADGTRGWVGHECNYQN